MMRIQHEILQRLYLCSLHVQRSYKSSCFSILLTLLSFQMHETTTFHCTTNFLNFKTRTDRIWNSKLKQKRQKLCIFKYILKLKEAIALVAILHKLHK